MPHNFKPRPYQKRLYEAIADGAKRGVAIWHRRSGKDKTMLNVTAKEMFKRVGTYNYFYPKYAQAKKAIWDGMDRSGFKYLNHFPKEIVRRKNDTELKVEVINGSIFQMIGTDNYDSIMSTNPIGTVWSEYSLHDPNAWEYVRPILLENGGWAFFLYTPRGRNHGFKLYKKALSNPKFFCELLTVEDTDMEHLVDEAREEGMEDELIAQEYYCSFDAPQRGAYYGKHIAEARKAGRITLVPHDPSQRVHTFWDLGVSDYMCIWFAQFVGIHVHLIDYYQNCNFGLNHYVNVLEDKRKEFRYLYGQHWAPHDIDHRTLGKGLTVRREAAEDLGIEFRVVPITSVQDGIEAVRKLIPRCWFDEVKTDVGVSCLENYRKSWNEVLQVYSNVPLHDENSHGADAFRTLAVGIIAGAGTESEADAATVRAMLARRGITY